MPEGVDQDPGAEEGILRKRNLLLLEEIRMRDLQAELPLHLQEGLDTIQTD